MTEPHAVQDVVGLGELNIRVGRDLDTVSPRIEKIQKTPVKYLDTHLLQRLLDQGLVVDGNAEMPRPVRPLLTPKGEVDELVSEIDERGRFAAPVQLEVEEAAIEGLRLVDVADFQGNVVDSYGACFLNR